MRQGSLGLLRGAAFTLGATPTDLRSRSTYSVTSVSELSLTDRTRCSAMYLCPPSGQIMRMYPIRVASTRAKRILHPFVSVTVIVGSGRSAAVALSAIEGTGNPGRLSAADGVGSARGLSLDEGPWGGTASTESAGIGCGSVASGDSCAEQSTGTANPSPRISARIITETIAANLLRGDQIRLGGEADYTRSTKLPSRVSIVADAAGQGAAGAISGCPISKLLNATITMEARLEG